MNSIYEADNLTFDHEVRRSPLPVLVDFWAPWCGPCRALSPALEKLAAEGDGMWELVKANIDDLGPIAGQFGVSSVPTVLGLRNGEVIDGFVGALPEAQIKEWLQRILPSESEQATKAAVELAKTDPAAAEAMLRAAWESAAANESGAPIALGQLLLKQGRLDDAREVVEQLERRGYLEPEAEQLRAEIDLKQKAAGAGNLDEIRAELDKNPEDFGNQLRLAEALAAAGEHREAFERALALVIDDRQKTGETAKQLMIDLFQVPGVDEELAAEFQRKLSSALY